MIQAIKNLVLPVACFGLTGICDATEKPQITAMPPIQYLNVTWEHHDGLVQQLANQIHESGWDFDTIVCIARGGLLAGIHMSHLMDGKELATIATRSYRGHNGMEQKELVISEHIAMTASGLGKRVLLIDDLVDSGVSIEKVKEHILKKHPEVEEIRTAVLFYKKCSIHTPSYFGEIVEKQIWIVLPFEKAITP